MTKHEIVVTSSLLEFPLDQVRGKWTSCCVIAGVSNQTLWTPDCCAMLLSDTYSIFIISFPGQAALDQHQGECVRRSVHDSL